MLMFVLFFNPQPDKYRLAAFSVVEGAGEALDRFEQEFGGAMTPLAVFGVGSKLHWTTLEPGQAEAIYDEVNKQVRLCSLYGAI